MSTRRVYYDHEPAYRQIRESGGRGWDDLPGSHAGDSYRGCAEFVADYCAGRSIDAVLDLGCGGGQAGWLLIDQCRELVGVDYSETAIAIARQNAAGRPHARYVVGDCTVQRPGRYDVVLDNHTLHCLIDPGDRAQFLAGIAAVLTEDGLLFSETMSREGRFAAAAFGVAPPRYVNASRTRRWISARELNAELAAAGLEVVEQRQRHQRDDPAPGDLIWTVARLARPAR